jgi:ATP-dependent protease ClpP protease subunit
MIKRLLVSLAVFLFPLSSMAVHVVSKEAHIDIETSKVATIESDISGESAVSFLRQMDETMIIPGDRVILIDSPGGQVDAGMAMIGRIEIEKAMGSRVICVVEHAAHSMAFNLLTHCDVRLARPKSFMIFHKVAVELCSNPDHSGPRLTPKNLRKIANDLQRMDELFRRPNATALHMSLPDYDLFCEHDTAWTAMSLYTRGYLNGFATLQK